MKNYFKIPHHAFDGLFRNYSASVAYLYCYLWRLDNRYGDKNHSFFHRDKELSFETGLSMAIIKRSKKILKDEGLIEYDVKGWGAKKATIYRLMSFHS